MVEPFLFFLFEDVPFPLSALAQVSVLAEPGALVGGLLPLPFFFFGLLVCLEFRSAHAPCSSTTG